MCACDCSLHHVWFVWAEWILEGTVPVKHLRPHRSTESSSSRRSHKHRHKRRHHHRSSKHSSAHHSRHHGDDAGSQSRAPKGKHGSHTYGMAIAPLIWGSSQGGGASSGARGSTGVTHHAGDSGVASDNLLAPPMGAIEMKVPHATVAMTPRARAGTDFVACLQNASASVFPPLDPSKRSSLAPVGVESSSHAHVMGRHRRVRHQRYNSHAHSYGQHASHGATVGRTNGYNVLSIGQRYNNVTNHSKRSAERKPEPVFSTRYHYK